MWLVPLVALTAILNQFQSSMATVIPPIDNTPIGESTSLAVAIGHNTDTRTVLNIIFSCTCTLVLSMAYCIRPNIPSRDSNFSLLRAKLKIAFWLLICPESVLYWAFSQWNLARQIEKTHAGSSIVTWFYVTLPELHYQPEDGPKRTGYT